MFQHTAPHETRLIVRMVYRVGLLFEYLSLEKKDVSGIKKTKTGLFRSVFLPALLAGAFLISPSYAQVTGTDTTPGAACSVEDSVQMTANPSGTGGYVLTCEGGIWVATINVATPTANEQAVPKAYVDSAVAAGGIGACVDDDATLCALDTSRSSDDPDFTAGNIASGINILGVTGTLSGGCTAPASCTNVGDTCSDGSQFAGFMIRNGDECTVLYVTDTNQSTSSQWKNATGTNDISPDDLYDGQANHTNRSGTLSDFPAFELCENLNRHGKTDWYLPSREELDLLHTNRAAIGGFTTSNYWSSTEYANTNNSAWRQYLDFGDQSGHTKTQSYYVRCVRRD